MGYQTQILIAVAGPPDVLKAAVVKFRLVAEHTSFFTEFELIDGKNGADDVIAIHETCKWYSSDPGVRAAEAFYAMAEEASGAYEGEEPHLYGCFLSVGEDTDDISEKAFGHDHGNPSDLGHICRSVELNFEAWQRVGAPEEL